MDFLQATVVDGCGGGTSKPNLVLSQKRIPFEGISSTIKFKFENTYVIVGYHTMPGSCLAKREMGDQFMS